MKLGWIDKAMGAAIAGSVFTMMESTSHAVSSVISAAFNASASPEGRILAAGIALSGVAIEGYAAFLAANWAAIGHSVSSRPDTNDSNKTTAITAAALKPSDRMPDGTVYAGISPESGKPMYTTPGDAPGTYTLNQAKDYAVDLCVFDRYHDWRVPTKGELNVLFNNRAAIGGFNETDFYARWYWSSSGDNCEFAVAQCFTDGHETVAYMDAPGSLHGDMSLRCVRG